MLSQTNPGFYVSAVQDFWKHCGKGEIARNEQFLLFRQCFLPICMDFLPFSSNLKLSSANSFSLEESKICCLGKGSWLADLNSVSNVLDLYVSTIPSFKWMWAMVAEKNCYEKYCLRRTDRGTPVYPLLLRSKGIKTLWENNKMLVSSIFLFLTMFSKGAFLSGCKSCHCMPYYATCLNLL